MNDYYDQQILIPNVDEQDTFLAPVERWEAHEKGILHRAFTVGLLYQDTFICQHRKHPVFGKWFDLSASSHPQVFEDGTIQANEDAVYKTLEREWHMQAEQVKGLHNRGHVIYTAHDPNSRYIEHEYCHFFVATIDELPSFEPELYVRGIQACNP
jgi:isopentenyl-diphosphate delta-isomerase